MARNLCMELTLIIGSLLVFGGAVSAATFTVTKTADTNDGTCSMADCSLREATIAANGAPGADTIALPAGVYVLTLVGTNEDAAMSGDLDVNGDVTLTGAGAATTAIDANATDNAFHVLSGTFTASNVGIRRGAPAAISNDNGSVVLDAVEITGSGTGIASNTGGVSIANSTISGNGVLPDAPALLPAAIAALGGIVDVVNSTISGNAQGALFTIAPVTMTNVTIAANGGSFGAVFAFGGSSVTNTILANNDPSNCLYLLTSNGHNLDDDGTCALTGPGDITGVDAGLVFLGANGGPTRTHALAQGSPALDVGDAGTCPAADQRGIARPVNGTCDIGAFEGPPCFATPDGARCDNDLNLCDGAVGTCTGGVCSVSPGDPCPATECNTTCQESTVSCFDAQGTPCTEDSNPCSQDRCSVGSCTHPDAPDRTPCNDHISCNGTDLCVQGACFHSTSCVAVLPMDNYQCWQAKDLRVPDRFQTIVGVPMSDQFATASVDVKKPALLCNPADTDGSGINDPTAHICCYKAKGDKLSPRPRAEITDEFGTRQLEMRRPQLVCRPCTKTLLP